MNPGDLVLFLEATAAPFVSRPTIGVFLGSRRYKLRSVGPKFCTFLTPEGVREVLLGCPGTAWEVLSEPR